MTGLDCSHYQGKIDFQKLATNQPPIQFIYFKATQGTGYIDPMLKINASGAQSIGLPFGYYHFATLNTNNIVQDAQAEAKYFLSILQSLPKYTLPLVLDIEDDKGAENSNLTPVDILGWINSFFDILKDRGHDNYALYSYTQFLNKWLSQAHGLGSTKLWIAQYTSRSKPTLPAGWKEFYLWQYSAKGNVKGIVGNVDMNTSFNSLY